MRAARVIRSSLLACLVLAIGACSDGSDSPLDQGPFAVSVSEWRVIDDTRGTPPTGEFPALPTRTLDTLVFMPEGGGRFPLLIFSHGLGATPLVYEALIERVAAAGFVVVAPAFPLTSANAPAGPDPVDTQQQPGDVSFLIDAVSTAVTESAAPFNRRVDVENVGTFGHSNGGITTLGILAHSCCRDERIDAAISLSATAAPYNNGAYDFSATAPLMLIHGTADALIPHEESIRVFNDVAAAKGILLMQDVEHSTFVAPSGHGFESAANSIIDFFRTHLKGDGEAEDRLIDGIVYDTAVELTYSASGGTDITLPLPPPVTDRVAGVEPNTNLVDGQFVTVSWRNYIAGNTINVLQCSAGGLGGNDVCDFSNGLILQPNPTGEGSLQLEIIVGDVGSGRCDATTDDCVIVVNDGGSQTDEATLRLPISFAP
ncbi:MAG: hypothetical protein Hals2KO_35860 [Halioglobus sp.]